MKKTISDLDLSLLISDTFDKLNEHLDNNFIVLPSRYLRFLSKWYAEEIFTLISDDAYLSRIANKEF